jgi:heterodisulfide reductase subunit C
MNLRRVLLSLQRGREKETLPMLRHCMLCGKCLLVCPRGINTRHLILSIGKVYGLDEKEEDAR